MPENKLFISGAAGLIGTVLREGLRDTYAITGVDRRTKRRDRDVRRLDVRNPRALERALQGHDVVIDLATDPLQYATPWRIVYSNNLRTVYGAFEAARQAGVRRLIYASSNHVTGMYERDEPYARILSGNRTGLDPGRVKRISVDVPIRPGNLYGVGKAFGEALGRFYSEEYGLSVICLRLGSVNRDDQPSGPRHLSTLLSHRDLVQLFRRCIEAPEDLNYAIFYGVSANTWRIWNIDDAREMIGYEPQDDAEIWQGRV